MDASDDSLTTTDQDTAVESAVMQQLLDLHPTQVTVAELVREIAGQGARFAERDAVERAVRDLGAVGLIHSGEGLVLPTRAALRFSELLDR